jgi:fructokinase
MIAHVAIAARRLGMRSAFIGKVGNDPFGHHLHNVLRTEGVGTSGLRFDDHAHTTPSFHSMPSPDVSEYAHYRNPGADTMLGDDQLDEQLLSEARIFHFGSLSIMHDPSRSATRRAISIAEQNENLITFGVSYQPSLWHDPDEARIRILISSICASCDCGSIRSAPSMRNRRCRRGQPNLAQLWPAGMRRHWRGWQRLCTHGLVCAES